jgi:hypothetical protein
MLNYVLKKDAINDFGINTGLNVFSSEKKIAIKCNN